MASAQPADSTKTAQVSPPAHLPPGYSNPIWLREGRDGRKLWKVRDEAKRLCALMLVRMGDGGLEGVEEFRSLQVSRTILDRGKEHGNLLVYRKAWLEVREGEFIEVTESAGPYRSSGCEGMDLFVEMELPGKSLADKLWECR